MSPAWQELGWFRGRTGPVVGVDACRDGWVACVPGLDGTPNWRVQPSLAHVLDSIDAEPAIVVVDIPIGLPGAPPRSCDKEAKNLLGARASTVFFALPRALLEMPYTLANAASRQQFGRGISRQSFGIGAKCLEANATVAAHPWGMLAVEGHPELGFLALNGGRPVPLSKHTEEGLEARRQLLGLPGPAPWTAGAAEDDLLDSLCLALAGRRIVEGKGRQVPDGACPVDSQGLPMRIVF